MLKPAAVERIGQAELESRDNATRYMDGLLLGL